MLRLILLVAFLLSEPPALAKKPSRTRVLAALKAASVAKLIRVSNVIPGARPNEYLALYVTKAKRETFETRPGVARIRVKGGDVQLIGRVDVPCSRTVWNGWEGEMEEFWFRWGAAVVKDVDGDGSPELTLFYGYTTESYRAIGSYQVREVTWFRLGPTGAPVPQLHLLLDQSHGGVTSRFRYVKSKAGKPYRDLVVTRTAEPDDGPKTTTRIRYVYDAKKDTWAAAPKK